MTTIHDWIRLTSDSLGFGGQLLKAIGNPLFVNKEEIAFAFTPKTKERPEKQRMR